MFKYCSAQNIYSWLSKPWFSQADNKEKVLVVKKTA